MAVKRTPKPAAKRKATVARASAAESAAPAPARGRQRPPVDLGRAVVEAAAVNERMNQFLLAGLDERAWRAEPPGKTGKPGQNGRTIAAIVAHVHNVRHMWLVVSAKGFPCPDKLERASVTLREARAALAESHAAIEALFQRSVADGGRVKDFRPDVVGFLAYLVAHEAHHRGQIALLARQAGFPLAQEVGFGLWEWGKRWKECGYDR